MVTLGIDAHKRTHTIVAVDARGRQLAVKTIPTTTRDHLALLMWAEQFADDDRLLWAIEDCRHLSRRLERDLPASGQSIVGVPTKLTAHVRDSARTYGKSDPIDALAAPRGLVDRCRELTVQINERTAEITILISAMAPTLIAIPGCGCPDRGEDPR